MPDILILIVLLVHYPVTTFTWSVNVPRVCLISLLYPPYCSWMMSYLFFSAAFLSVTYVLSILSIPHPQATFTLTCPGIKFFGGSTPLLPPTILETSIQSPNQKNERKNKFKQNYQTMTERQPLHPNRGIKTERIFYFSVFLKKKKNNM